MNKSGVIFLCLLVSCALFTIYSIHAHTVVDQAYECAEIKQAAFDRGRRWERLRVALAERQGGYADLEGLMHNIAVWTARLSTTRPEITDNWDNVLSYQESTADRLAELIKEDRSLFVSMNQYPEVLDLGTGDREYVPIPFVTLEMHGFVAAEQYDSLREELTTVREELIDMLSKEDGEAQHKSGSNGP